MLRANPRSYGKTQLCSVSQSWTQSMYVTQPHAEMRCRCLASSSEHIFFYFQTWNPQLSVHIVLSPLAANDKCIIFVFGHVSHFDTKELQVQSYLNSRKYSQNADSLPSEGFFSFSEEIHKVYGLTSLWGSPAAEKIGIFCPLAMLFMPSMAEMPVWIISSGQIRH